MKLFINFFLFSNLPQSVKPVLLGNSLKLLYLNTLIHCCHFIQVQLSVPSRCEGQMIQTAPSQGNFSGICFVSGCKGFPGGSAVKNPPANAGDTRDPWVRKIPWREERQPTPGLLPGKSHGQRSLAGCSPWGRRESDMSEPLTHTVTTLGLLSCVYKTETICTQLVG